MIMMILRIKNRFSDLSFPCIAKSAVNSAKWTSNRFFQYHFRTKVLICQLEFGLKTAREPGSAKPLQGIARQIARKQRFCYNQPNRAEEADSMASPSVASKPARS